MRITVRLNTEQVVTLQKLDGRKISDKLRTAIKIAGIQKEEETSKQERVEPQSLPSPT